MDGVVSRHDCLVSEARSNRVHRAGKVVMDDFVAKHPHIDVEMLTRKNSKNHPKCMHPRLLSAMVKALYPDGGVYVHSEDAAWIASRAPELPRSTKKTDPSHNFGVRDHDPSDGDEAVRGCGDDGGTRTVGGPIECDYDGTISDARGPAVRHLSIFGENRDASGSKFGTRSINDDGDTFDSSVKQQI